MTCVIWVTDCRTARALAIRCCIDLAFTEKSMSSQVERRLIPTVLSRVSGIVEEQHNFLDNWSSRSATEDAAGLDEKDADYIWQVCF